MKTKQAVCKNTLLSPLTALARRLLWTTGKKTVSSVKMSLFQAFCDNNFRSRRGFVYMPASNAASTQTVIPIFLACAQAIRTNHLIVRENRSDKEFHFQNWIRDRLTGTRFQYEAGGRNSYPDFRIVQMPEGFEVKGLAYPGREVNYDCNSQVPSGFHNGRTIYYIFGRYPSEPDGNAYPVLDFVLCHGDFLNADHNYVHKNKSVKGFGSYGDIMIRDRKMYVAPTPFGIAAGLAHTVTLILPEGINPPSDQFKEVGRIVRTEAPHLIISYAFDLRTNSISPQLLPNPSAGQEHKFRAWRLLEGSDDRVILRARSSAVVVADVEDLDDE